MAKKSGGFEGQGAPCNKRVPRAAVSENRRKARAQGEAGQGQGFTVSLVLC